MQVLTMESVGLLEIIVCMLSCITILEVLYIWKYPTVWVHTLYYIQKPISAMLVVNIWALRWCNNLSVVNKWFI